MTFERELYAPATGGRIYILSSLLASSVMLILCFKVFIFFKIRTNRVSDVRKYVYRCYFMHGGTYLIGYLSETMLYCASIRSNQRYSGIMTEFELTPAYQEAKYLTSAAECDQLPSDEGAEVAFIGRSNAGKSSTLNVITGIKGLARISKTPGRTQMINFFALNEYERLVDLPGYGYAKVPRMVKKRWEELVDNYLKNRQCLKGLVVVMDIRHPLKEIDENVVEWAVNYSIPVHILLTKSDKLSQNASKKTLGETQKSISAYGKKLTLQLFSSHNRTGLDEIKVVLSHWFRSDLIKIKQ